MHEKKTTGLERGYESLSTYFHDSIPLYGTMALEIIVRKRLRYFYIQIRE